ncbi:hypothetical protein IJJ08_02825 [bacterium]|nr:hypothetical protein [bacterium]
MADENLKTPAKKSSDPVAVKQLSAAKRKQLLNSYLQSAKNDTTTSSPSHKKKPTVARSTKINRPHVKQLGDLQELLDDHPDSSRLAAGVKQLGSIEAILQGNARPLPAQVVPDTVSPYQKANLFAKANQEKPDTLDTSAFSDDQETTTSSSVNRNLPVFAAAVFGIGTCVFGINQLIKNANYNFASEDIGQQQPAASPPRILTFQGRLTDYDQNSITAPKKMRFVFYNTSGGNTPPPIGGEILWDSGVCTIQPNSSGIFTVNLGAGRGDGFDDANCGQTLGNIFAQNSNVWVQISVDNEVLFPRQLIKSVPFALNSESLQGYSASQSATANTIPVVDGNGNFKFATSDTAIINIGNLGLVSQTGDLYLLPGSGNIYMGTATASANLNLSGNLNLQGKNSAVTYDETGLTFRSNVAKTAWNSAYIDKNGNLGLGTTNTKQKLTINNGSIAFEFISGPDISKMTINEDITDVNALRKISAPTNNLTLSTQEQSESKLVAGRYQYAYTFVTSDGAETSLSPARAYDLTKDGQAIIINDLATSDHPSVVARNLYRTKNNGSEYYLVKTIPDNTSHSTFDIVNDYTLTQAFNNTNNTGLYRYKLTFVGENGESSPSDSSRALALTGDGRVIKIDHIPVPSSSEQITARRLYRSLSNSEDYYLVAELTDSTVTTVYDHLSDYELVTKEKMPSAASIYTNGRLSLQFAPDGTIKTQEDLVAGGRLEASYGDNQGLKLPTSAGKPYAKVGQQVGDIVYDSLGQVLYIYNGTDFVPTGVTNTNSVTLANSSHCSGNTCRLVLDAEYAGAVISGDGTNNNGTFSSGHETIGDNYRFNYYAWQSSDLTTINDFDTTVNLTLPSNFVSWQSSGLTLDFATSSVDPSLNHVTLEVYRGGTQIGVTKADLVSNVAGEWMSHALTTTPATISGEELTNLGFKAGDQLTIKITTASRQSQEVKIGQINLNYLTDSGIVDTGSQSLWKQVAGALFPATTTNDVILGGESTASAKIGFFNLAGTGTPTLFVRGNLFMDSQNKQNNLDLAERASFNIRTLNAEGNPTTRFTILPNGNIGIGTTTPTEALEVQGNIKANGSLQLTPIDAATAGECNADVEGKIYYDRQQKTFYACQANLTTGLYSWQALN